MADTRWFHRDFVTAAMPSSMEATPHSTPDHNIGRVLQGAQAFHIPGG